MTRPITGRLRPACLALRLACIVFVATAFLPACGKRGLPLPPLVKVPARPDVFVARRLGSTVYLQVKIPVVNVDGTSPADIEQIDVYGFTGLPLDNETIFKTGMLVASIPVRKPPEEDVVAAAPAKPGGKPAAKPEERPAAPPRPPTSMENGFDQGDTIVVTEPLGPVQYLEVVPKTKKPVPLVEEPVKPRPRPLGPPPLVALPSRLYLAVGVNHKGQKGAISARQVVLLAAPASAPSAPTVTYNETSLVVSWTPPADAWHAIQDSAAAGVLKATLIGMRSVSGAYNVYDVSPPALSPGAVKAPIPPAAGGLMPTPANDKPILEPPFVDKRIEFGKTRCYAVRAVSVFGTPSIESDTSPAQCVTPVDTFAPAAPTSLNAVGSDGAISLIWEANKETDLAGYVLMRATLPGGEWKIVTADPIKETTFNDTTVVRGVRYAYVVVAVDTARNLSVKSNQVEESAR